MNYFKIFNSCRIVKGAANALIYDLDRPSNSSKIPLSLYEILNEHNTKPISEIKSFYKNKFNNVIDEYF